MKPLRRLLNLSFSSVGATFDQGPFWTRSLLAASLGDKELIENDFVSYVERAYKANGIVFACILARLAVFSQARLQFQRLVNGRPGDLFPGAPGDLALLEEPWPNGTTSDLLARMEQDASLAGNFFATPVDDRVRRLRPDWTTIVTGSRSGGGPYALDAEPVAIMYRPGGGLTDPVLVPAEQVVHYAPLPDPAAQWRGISWITPIAAEVNADSAATKHKHIFFKRGATSNLAITYDKSSTKEQVKVFAELFREQYEGVDNAYKTLHLGGGADPKMIGADLKQLDFKITQGAGETRIAAASGVGAVVAQFSEGLGGSALNTGNYGAARRRFSDITMQHLWLSAASSLAKLVAVPSGARLWFDGRDIPFLQEDAKDASEILKERMLTIESAVRAGYTPDSAVAAVDADDLALLEHTGLFSVQLQPPGTGQPAPAAAA